MPNAPSRPSSGLLLVLMEPPASLEEEFNDWYDTEHFPQRMGLPGFLDGARWACLQGWPRWAACYELQDVGALQTTQYRAVSAANATPWSKRILPRTTGRRRIIATLADPGLCPRPGGGQAAFLVIGQYSASHGTPAPDGLAALAAACERFGASSLFLGCAQDDGSLWLVAGFPGVVVGDGLLHALADGPAGKAMLLNTYVRYCRG